MIEGVRMNGSSDAEAASGSLSPHLSGQRPKWVLTQQAFDALLQSLSPDRDTAASKYLEIRRNLVRFFEWRGCTFPEDHADETINRGARRIAEGEEIRDPATYLIGVARMLLLEIGRQRTKEPRAVDDLADAHAASYEIEHDLGRRVACLKRCLEQISPENRDLILCYYEGDKSEKIKNRKRLLERFKTSANTLRMRALRIREKLQLCVNECLRQEAEG